jgi:hypothetical protein
MMRVVLVLVLVAAVGLALPGTTSLAQEVLTNDSVVQMIKAGLPEPVVVAKIKSTTAMPAPPAAAVATGSLKNQDVIYQLVGEKYVEMFPTSANLETNMAFFQSKSEVVLEGRKAKFRITEKQPVFLSTYSTTDAPLVKLKPGDDHNDRNLKIGGGAFHPFGGTQKMGVRNEDKIDLNIERDARGFYRVSPSKPLPPGEYGFILATGFGAGSGKIYDFGVD